MNIYVVQSTKKYIHASADELQKHEVVLIPGALVFSDGRLSNMTKDRADKGIELYQKGLVNKILVSGDHGTNGYDEVNTIRNYILEKGIPAEDVFMDHAGFTTFNSMYRARDIFKVRDMIIVTQDFHLPRAVFLARSLGMDAEGLNSSVKNYSKRNVAYLNMREWSARIKAFLQVNIFHSKPRFLGEVIPITGDGRVTEDKKR